MKNLSNGLKYAFLNGHLEEVYVKQHIGYVRKTKNKKN